MFEEIFSRPTALRRHREGPLASERQEYLQHLKDRGAATGTVIRQARYCLSIAREIQQYPRDYCFKATELEAIAASWAARRVKQGWADTPRWPTSPPKAVAILPPSDFHELSRAARPKRQKGRFEWHHSQPLDSRNFLGALTTRNV